MVLRRHTQATPTEVLAVKYQWPPIQPELPEAQPERPTLAQVLIETDMPELVVAERNGERWIGVVSEVFNRTSRWVYAPISSVEYRALIAGAAEVWECFRKPRVLVVDETEQSETVTEIDGDFVPLGALPSRGFVLPEWARPEQSQRVEPPQFALARAHGVGAIGLKALAAVSDKIQRLYVAVVQRLMDGFATTAGSVSSAVRDAAEIDVEGLVNGSLIIKVRPNNEERFVEASQAIQEILTTTDSHALLELFDRLGGRVRGRYEDLLDEVVTHDLALLMSWGMGRHNFIAAHTASRRIEALPASGPREDDTWLARGYLLGFDPVPRSFTFYELRTDEEITGRVADSFAVPEQLLVGPSTPLRVVEIGRSKLSTRGGKDVTRHQLLRILPDAETGAHTRRSTTA